RPAHRRLVRAPGVRSARRGRGAGRSARDCYGDNVFGTGASLAEPGNGCDPLSVCARNGVLEAHTRVGRKTKRYGRGGSHMNFRRALFAAFIAASVVVTACGGAGTGGTKPAVTVGSTNFYEQLTLGELYSQILEANGYTVTRKFNLGNREIVEPAIESGQIDIDAEYLATLLAFVDKDGKVAKPTTDPKETQIGLQKALDPKGLTVLDYAAATDQNGFVVTQATASSKNLKKLSDLAPIGNTLVLGGPPE